MKMREDENITKYVERIKASVSAIRASRGKIDDTTFVRKVIRTLLPNNEISVSNIQEMRCDLNNKINLDALVGRLTTFELDNYDNYVCSSINLEYEFKDKLSLKKKATKGKHSKSEEEDNSSSNLESIEALLTKRYPKGKGKYKDKIPPMYFSCE